MHNRLTLTTALMLLVPPLMWAGNAIIGRMVSGVVPPMTELLIVAPAIVPPVIAGALSPLVTLP